MINRFSSLDDLVFGSTLQKLQSLIEEKVKDEHKRVESVRAESSNYANNVKWKKIPQEIFQLEKVY